MTQAWIDWEQNLLLLLKGETSRAREALKNDGEDKDEVFATLTEALLALFYQHLEDLYFTQYLGVEWEADMANPIIPKELGEGEILDKKVGKQTLRRRIEDAVDMAQFYYEADPDGRRESAWDTVSTRLETYVRTEGHRMMNQARNQAFDDVLQEYPDTNATKTWDATLDDVTRPTHRALHGTTIGPNEFFWTYNGAALYPGGFGVAEEDVNCRCVVICSLNGSFARVKSKTDFVAWLREVLPDG